MPAQIANRNERDMLNKWAKNKVRLRNPITGALLHLSGTGSTTNLNHAWLGLLRQAETLRQRAIIRGEDWPYQPVHRDLLEPAPAPEDA